MRFFRIVARRRLIAPAWILVLVCAVLPSAYSQNEYAPVADGIFPYTYMPGTKDSAAISAALDSAILVFGRNPDAAIPLFRQTLTEAIAARLAAIASDAFAYLNTIYNNKGQYDRVYWETLKVQSLARAYKMDAMLPAVYNSFANRYQRTGQMDSAVFYYYKAIDVVEKDPAFFNKSALSSLYTNLSSVLESMGDHEKGLKYLIKAEHIAVSTGNEDILALILINKGNAYANLGDLAQSIKSLKEALQIARKNRSIQWQHLALSNLGSASHELGKNEEALSYLKEAVQIKGNIDPSYQNINITLLGQVYFAMKNYAQAEQYLLQSLQTGERLNIARNRLEGNKMLAWLYAQTGVYKKAFEHQYAYTQIKDSIRSEESKQNINQLEIKYQTSQKDKALVEKELKINKQLSQIRKKNLWIGLIASGTFLLLIIGLLLYRVNKHKQRLQAEKLLTLEQEHVIDQLKAVMIGEEKERTRIARGLHDGIGSMLASMKMHLGAFSEAHPELQTANNLNKLSDILSSTAIEVRKTAHNLMPDVLARQNLKRALLQYCENNNNAGLHIDLQYHVAPPLSKGVELFIYRIVQELVQNIVKHAEADHAVIQIMLHENHLSIMVEDNGIGFDTTIAYNGMGLQNLRLRTEALHGYISIDSRQRMGTTVHVKFDYTQLGNL